MMMGYHYDQPKRGGGVSLQAGNLYIASMTKASANEIKKELIRNGFDKEEIKIENN